MPAKEIALGVWDLGQWKPRGLEQFIVNNHFRIDIRFWMRRLRKIPNIKNPSTFEIRSPYFGGQIDTRITHWHHDCGGHWNLVWASYKPTELTPVRPHLQGQKEPKLKPWYIYAFDNELYLHRLPPGAYPKTNRWFARAYLLNKKDLKCE